MNNFRVRGHLAWSIACSCRSNLFMSSNGGGKPNGKLSNCTSIGRVSWTSNRWNLLLDLWDFDGFCHITLLRPCSWFSDHGSWWWRAMASRRWIWQVRAQLEVDESKGSRARHFADADAWTKHWNCRIYTGMGIPLRVLRPHSHIASIQMRYMRMEREIDDTGVGKPAQQHLKELIMGPGFSVIFHFSACFSWRRSISNSWAP